MTQWNDAEIDCDPEGRDDQPRQDSYRLLPEGEYKFLATDPVPKIAKSSGNKMLELTMKFMDDALLDHAPLKKFVVLIPRGKPGHGFTIMALKAFGVPVKEGSIRVTPADFNLRLVMGKVVVKKLDSGKEVNDIEDLKPMPSEDASFASDTAGEPAQESAQQDPPQDPPAAEEEVPGVPF